MLQQENTSYTIADIGNSSACHLTREHEQFFLDYLWWFEAVVPSIMCTSGFSLNMVTIVVLAGATMRNDFFNQLLICLAISDSLFLISGISEIVRKNTEESKDYDEVFVCFLYPVRSMLFMCSMYICMSLTIERYSACLLYTSPRPRDATLSRMQSSA